MQHEAEIKKVLATLNLNEVKLSLPIVGIVSPVHRGVENICLFATTPDQKRVFVKQRHEDMVPFIVSSNVIEASDKAGKLGIAPQLLSANEDHCILIFEALGDEWRWGHADILRRPKVLENLLSAKSIFQQAPAICETRSVFDMIKDYFEIANRFNVILPRQIYSTSALVQHITNAIIASGFDRVPCHADGASSNIMIGPNDKVLLVDFEWARQADPHYDLGTILAEIFPFDGEALLAIEIAMGKPDATVLARARLYSAADDLMWALWGFISAAQSPRSHVEFFKYAEWRLLRARTITEGPRFEKWLKQC